MFVKGEGLHFIELMEKETSATVTAPLSKHRYLSNKFLAHVSELRKYVFMS
jgi:hypothetical protein